VKFVVSKTGKVTDAKISRGIDPSLDKEAVRIVESMPRWSPGKQHGLAVDVTYVVPVNFNMPADYHPKSKEKLKATTSSKIGNISWVNNTVYSSGNLTEVLGLKKGDKFSQENIKGRINGEVSNLYLDNGYLFSNIQITETPKSDGVVDLTFTIYEGNRGKIGKIEISGNKSVSTKDILNRISLKSGDWFSKAKLIQSVRAVSMIDKINPETVNPRINTEVQTAYNKVTNVDIVFEVTEK
jgi:outer membrane protein insertion porin family